VKRMSIAEQTLKKQIDALNDRLATLNASRRDIEMMIETTEEIKENLESEKYNLLRERQSDIRKPK
jgi:prefoldin subunit 5